jgi:hypothetical protein
VHRRLPHLIAAVLAVALLAGSCSGSSDKPTLEEAAVDRVVEGCDADRFPYHVATAKNRGDLAIYPAPGAPTPTTALPNPRLTDSDPPLERDLGFLVASEPKDNDCEWIEVFLPVRPNGTTGWVRRSDVQVEGHSFRIEVHLADFNLKAFEGDEVILDAPIATAEDNTPTPGGLYYTTELLPTGDPDSLYGPYAYGLSGFSEKLLSFNGGQGQLGIHGTNQPEKMGQKVSAGCIRLRNEDIEKLVETLEAAELEIGIPVQVYA